MTSTPVSRRSPRLAIPAPPSGDIQLQSPPPLPRTSGGQAVTQLTVMLPMMLMMGVMSFSYIGSQSGAMTIVFGALYGGMMVTMLVTSLGRAGAGRKRQLNEERRDYLRYLAGLRKQVRRNALRQRALLLLAHPDPDSLVAVAATERVWERRSSDGDFAHVRVGTGPQRLSTTLKPPQTVPIEDLDPVTSTSLRHFIRTYTTVSELPVALSLRGFAGIVLLGARSITLSHTRAVLGQLAVFHAAEEMRIALCVSPGRLDEWDWLKWLPHVRHREEIGPVGHRLLVAERLSDLEDMLAPELSGRGPFGSGGRAAASPHIVIVVDGGDCDESRLNRPEGIDAVTIIDLDGGRRPRVRELRLVAEEQRLGIDNEDRIDFIGNPDLLSAPGALSLARQLATMAGPASGEGGEALAVSFGLPELLNIGDPRDLNPDNLIRARSRRDRLRVPIGIDDRGGPLVLDIREAAEGGMGPHGLVIGATGSGKSELLRTLVAGLAVMHSSETLNFVLVDFKGGATFAGLENLPHTAAVITNLAGDLGLVDRAADALQGELMRRQEALHQTGHASVRDHERARAAGARLHPFPTLVVIIDEFSELLSIRPEFIDVFVTIGRLGRSLGVHLLLASQRLEEGRLRGLDSHLSYRIGLRTFSASESRTVLGTPDAYELPSIPGSAYLRHDTTTLVRFRAAYVSGDLPPRGAPVAGPLAPNRIVAAFSMRSGSAPVPIAPPAETNEVPPEPSGTGESVLGVIVDRLVGDTPAHQVWLPPLGESTPLSRLLPPLSVDPKRGLSPRGWPGNGRLAVPVGIVDMPYEQRRDLLYADMSGAGGHAVVVGAPRAGKSTLLRSLVCAFALTHTPLEVQVYGLDFGGGSLAALEGLPHVGGIAAGRDPQRCVRAVAEVRSILADRERVFGELALDSMAAARQRYDSAGQRLFSDVFLLVDGWTIFREKQERLEEEVMNIARTGLSYGVHVVISANRWFDVRSALRDLIGTRFELRLGDPSDSDIDRRAASGVPENMPGRGLTRNKHHFLTALPSVDRPGAIEDLSTSMAVLIQAVAQAWRGPVAPPVRMLPLQIPIEALSTPTGPGLRVPFGIAESDLGQIDLDFDSDSHLVLFGDTESGKTSALATIATGVTRFPPERTRLIIADYRRGLLGHITTDHLLGHAFNEEQLTAMVADAVHSIRQRLPGPDITPEQLRNRNWWKGPDLFIIIDDYDLIAGSSQNPLTALVELLPHARDVGLHIVLARRSGGASRAMFDPLLARMRELGSPGFVLSADPDEGSLFGVRTTLRPPGRGQLVTRRGGVVLLQVAAAEPPA